MLKPAHLIAEHQGIDGVAGSKDGRRSSEFAVLNDAVRKE